MYLLIHLYTRCVENIIAVIDEAWKIKILLVSSNLFKMPHSFSGGDKIYSVELY